MYPKRCEKRSESISWQLKMMLNVPLKWLKYSFSISFHRIGTLICRFMAYVYFTVLFNYECHINLCKLCHSVNDLCIAVILYWAVLGISSMVLRHHQQRLTEPDRDYDMDIWSHQCKIHWGIITHPCSYFFCRLYKPPLKLGHGWVITAHTKP